MIEQIIRLQQPLCAALIELRKTDLMPSDSEISTMEIFLEVLKPIVEITGEKLVTISEENVCYGHSTTAEDFLNIKVQGTGNCSFVS